MNAVSNANLNYPDFSNSNRSAVERSVQKQIQTNPLTSPVPAEHTISPVISPVPAEHTPAGPVKTDQYIPAKASPVEMSGEYRIGSDADGNRKIIFDSPDQTRRTTYNTDQPDREVEALKKKIERLTEQSERESDPQKAERLYQELVRLETELRRKDTDAYRRQHSTVS